MPRNGSGYDEDFFAWTQQQASLLRKGKLSEVDVENLAEEIESMGRSDRREIDSRLEVLLAHLLKWRVQVNFRSPSWRGTIREQRRRIAKQLRESPSLRPFLDQHLPEAYEEACDKAVDDTGLPKATFPSICPFTPEQILDEAFLPED